MIFSKNPNSSRRSWIQIVNLPLLNKSSYSHKTFKPYKSHCEICGKSDVSLDKAHWIERAKGGSSKSFNILNLCPNCHRKLDRNDTFITESAKEILLVREASKLIKLKKDEKTFRKQLVKLCETIINRTT